MRKKTREGEEQDEKSRKEEAKHNTNHRKEINTGR